MGLTDHTPWTVKISGTHDPQHHGHGCHKAPAPWCISPLAKCSFPACLSPPTNPSFPALQTHCKKETWYFGYVINGSFSVIERARLTFALCLGFIIPRRKKSQLPTCVGSYHLVSRQILFCGIFSNCMREKTILVIYKIANYHVYIFWGSICLHNRCTITE